MRKPYSTKLPRPVPDEFVDAFARGGWGKVNRMYGKRAATRYATVIGLVTLRAARDAFLSAVRGVVAE